jgi:hypothetical protein
MGLSARSIILVAPSTALLPDFGVLETALGSSSEGLGEDEQSLLELKRLDARDRKEMGRHFPIPQILRNSLDSFAKRKLDIIRKRN